MAANEREKAGFKVYKLYPANQVPWAAIAAPAMAADAEAMKGWTPLTQRSNARRRIGGATVRVVVRAKDNLLYSTDINGINPGGPLDGATWKQSDTVAGSLVRKVGG